MVAEGDTELAKGNDHPLAGLAVEDLDFVLRLVLASGSLKDVAAAYGVSYPTIRGRLDRLIVRLKQALEGRPRDPMAELLGNLVERGEITASAAQSVLSLHRQETVPDSGERS